MASYSPAVATKARHLKTPLQLWIADNRKRLGLTPADLAQMTGVTTDTARGWESRGRPSEDALGILERRFGTAVPRGSEPEGGLSELVQAIREQTAAMRDLVNELRDSRGLSADVHERVAAIEAYAVEHELRLQADRRLRGLEPEPAPPSLSRLSPAGR